MGAGRNGSTDDGVRPYFLAIRRMYAEGNEELKPLVEKILSGENSEEALEEAKAKLDGDRPWEIVLEGTEQADRAFSLEEKTLYLLSKGLDVQRAIELLSRVELLRRPEIYDAVLDIVDRYLTDMERTHVLKNLVDTMAGSISYIEELNALDVDTQPMLDELRKHLEGGDLDAMEASALELPKRLEELRKEAMIEKARENLKELVAIITDLNRFNIKYDTKKITDLHGKLEALIEKEEGEKALAASEKLLGSVEKLLNKGLERIRDKTKQELEENIGLLRENEDIKKGLSQCEAMWEEDRTEAVDRLLSLREELFKRLSAQMQSDLDEVTNEFEERYEKLSAEFRKYEDAIKIAGLSIEGSCTMSEMHMEMLGSLDEIQEMLDEKSGAQEDIGPSDILAEIYNALKKHGEGIKESIDEVSGWKKIHESIENINKAMEGIEKFCDTYNTEVRTELEKLLATLEKALKDSGLKVDISALREACEKPDPDAMEKALIDLKGVLKEEAVKALKEKAAAAFKDVSPLLSRANKVLDTVHLYSAVVVVDDKREFPPPLLFRNEKQMAIYTDPGIDAAAGSIENADTVHALIDAVESLERSASEVARKLENRAHIFLKAAIKESLDIARTSIKELPNDKVKKIVPELKKAIEGYKKGDMETLAENVIAINSELGEIRLATAVDRAREMLSQLEEFIKEAETTLSNAVSNADLLRDVLTSNVVYDSTVPVLEDLEGVKKQIDNKLSELKDELDSTREYLENDFYIAVPARTPVIREGVEKLKKGTLESLKERVGAYCREWLDSFPGEMALPWNPDEVHSFEELQMAIESVVSAVSKAVENENRRIMKERIDRLEDVRGIIKEMMAIRVCPECSDRVREELAPALERMPAVSDEDDPVKVCTTIDDWFATEKIYQKFLDMAVDMLVEAIHTCRGIEKECQDVTKYLSPDRETDAAASDILKSVAEMTEMIEKGETTSVEAVKKAYQISTAAFELRHKLFEEHTREDLSVAIKKASSLKRYRDKARSLIEEVKRLLNDGRPVEAHDRITTAIEEIDGLLIREREEDLREGASAEMKRMELLKGIGGSVTSLEKMYGSIMDKIEKGDLDGAEKDLIKLHEKISSEREKHLGRMADDGLKELAGTLKAWSDYSEIADVADRQYTGLKDEISGLKGAEKYYIFRKGKAELLSKLKEAIHTFMAAKVKDARSQLEDVANEWALDLSDLLEELNDIRETADTPEELDKALTGIEGILSKTVGRRDELIERLTADLEDEWKALAGVAGKYGIEVETKKKVSISGKAEADAEAEDIRRAWDDLNGKAKEMALQRHSEEKEEMLVLLKGLSEFVSPETVNALNTRITGLLKSIEAEADSAPLNALDTLQSISSLKETLVAMNTLLEDLARLERQAVIISHYDDSYRTLLEDEDGIIKTRTWIEEMVLKEEDTAPVRERVESISSRIDKAWISVAEMARKGIIEKHQPTIEEAERRGIKKDIADIDNNDPLMSLYAVMKEVAILEGAVRDAVFSELENIAKEYKKHLDTISRLDLELDTEAYENTLRSARAMVLSRKYQEAIDQANAIIERIPGDIGEAKKKKILGLLAELNDIVDDLKIKEAPYEEVELKLSQAESLYEKDEIDSAIETAMEAIEFSREVLLKWRMDRAREQLDRINDVCSDMEEQDVDMAEERKLIEKMEELLASGDMDTVEKEMESLRDAVMKKKEEFVSSVKNNLLDTKKHIIAIGKLNIKVQGPMNLLNHAESEFEDGDYRSALKYAKKARDYADELKLKFAPDAEIPDIGAGKDEENSAESDSGKPKGKVKASPGKDSKDKKEAVAAIKKTWDIMKKTKDKGIDVSKAEEILDEARALLREGKTKESKEKAVESLRVLKEIILAAKKK